MKNYEKYGRELKKYRGGMFCDDYVKPDVLKLKKDDECDHDCIRCLVLQTLWLLEEYEEPKVDWNKVEVNTPILVRDYEDVKWQKRHFAKYENGFVYAWNRGCTSYTGADKIKWKYAKLAENEKECKESKVDWSKVEVDTPLLFRKYKNGEWSKRYFAKYEDGKVYTWYNGRTSWNEISMYAWDYAKLAEPEVDWSKVKVDTAIYVKASKYGNWFKRHFAEYKNGKIYTWGNGLTSHDTSRMMEWKYAKLVEDEE